MWFPKVNDFAVQWASVGKYLSIPYLAYYALMGNLSHWLYSCW